MTFNLHIQPQLDEIMSNLLSECNPAESFYDALKKPQWWTHRQFKDIQLHSGKREYSVEEWADVAEALQNVTFIPQLKQQLRDTIEHQWQIRLRDWDEDMRYQESLQEKELVA